MLAKVVLLDRESLLPGDSCYAQLRLTEPLASKRGDRFVIRFYSPLETIGGGVILDEVPLRHKAGDSAVLEALAIRESGSGNQKLVQVIAGFGYALPNKQKLCGELNLEEAELQEQLEELVALGKVLELLPDRYLAASVLDQAWDGCRKLLEAYHTANPLHAGMKLAELRQKLLPGTELAVADGVLAELAAEGRIKRVADRYAMAEFTVHFTKRQNAIRDKLLQTYRKADLEVPGVDEVYPMFLPKEKEDCKQVLESLISSGQLVMLTPQLYYHHQTFDRVLEQTRAFFAEKEELTLAEFRDMLGTSRKYALAVLEYYDRNKMTKKEGDIRRAGVALDQ
jgi:selenocysteine-specific elongation factor